MIFDTELDMSGFNSDLKKLSARASAGVTSDVMAGSGIDMSDFQADKNKLEQAAAQGLSADMEAGSGVDESEFYADKNRLESVASAGLTADVEAGSGIDTSGFEADAKKLDDVAKDALKNAGEPFNSNGELEIKARIDTGNTGKNSGIVSGILQANIVQKAAEQLWETGKAAVDLASDLQEVQNVVDVTFGDNADVIEAFAQTSLDAFGITELQAKQYTGTIGAMVKSMGLSEEAALGMSIGVAGLTGDIASFYNLDHEDAFEKIRSGISGETEPLKQLGINMSVANLEAFALANGIKESYDEMTEAEKVQLRYNYLMTATADAQGDFSRTYTGFANQTRLLKSNLDTISASVAEKFIPVMADALVAVNSFLGGLITEDGGKTELEKQISDVAAELDNIPGKIDDIRNNYGTTLLNIGFEYQSSQELLSDYETLLGIKDRSAEQTADMQEIVNTLVATYPELEKYVNKDGLFSRKVSRIDELITKYYELEKAEVHYALMSEMQAAYMASEVNLEHLSQLRDQAEADLEDAEARLAEVGNVENQFMGLNITTLGAGTVRSASPEDIQAYADAMNAYLSVFKGFDEDTLKRFSELGFNFTDFVDLDTMQVKEGLFFGSDYMAEDPQGFIQNINALAQAVGVLKETMLRGETGMEAELLEEIAHLQNAALTSSVELLDGTAMVEEARKAYERAYNDYLKYTGESVEDGADDYMEALEESEAKITAAGQTMTVKQANKMMQKDSYYRSGYQNGLALGKGERAGYAVSRLYSIGPVSNINATSHATGIPYVPYNNYRANLHIGEAVLNASEARAWRSGKGNNGAGIDSGTLAAIVDAAAEKIVRRPVSFGVDGKELASRQAGNNRIAIAERNREIAKGVGLK